MKVQKLYNPFEQVFISPDSENVWNFKKNRNSYDNGNR